MILCLGKLKEDLVSVSWMKICLASRNMFRRERLKEDIGEKRPRNRSDDID